MDREYMCVSDFTLTSNLDVCVCVLTCLLLVCLCDGYGDVASCFVEFSKRLRLGSASTHSHAHYPPKTTTYERNIMMNEDDDDDYDVAVITMNEKSERERERNHGMTIKGGAIRHPPLQASMLDHLCRRLENWSRKST